MSSPKTYRVGLLGFGFIGKVHAYGYMNLPLYCDPPPLAARITHVVTGRPETAEHARAAVGADFAGTDYRQVTENPNIDIVHICTPNHLHCQALLSAMAHQKHIYCDKPLVATIAEADAIEAALPAYRGVAQMTFQNRFFPATLRAKQLIEQGLLGQILEFRAAYLHGGSADPNVPLKWKLTAQAGGGVIADLASHVFDLLDHFLGPIAAVCAAGHRAYPDRPSPDNPAERVPVDTEDCVMLLARMKSGALGTIEATKIASGVEDELRIEIHGARGAIRFNLMEPHFLEYFDATQSDRPFGGDQGWRRIASGRRYDAPHTAFPSPKAAIGWLRGHAACLANFLLAIAQRQPADPGLRQGLRVQRVMEAVRASMETREWKEIRK